VAKATVASTNQSRIKHVFKINQGGTSKKGTIRDASQQRNAPRLHQRFAQVLLCLLELVGHDFVNDNASNAHLIMMTENSIQLQFIKRTALWYQTTKGHNELEVGQ
jgi:hypothetical protein